MPCQICAISAGFEMFQTTREKPCFLLYLSRLQWLCPGDGGVETAEEAVEPAEPDINELCTDMFEKMAIFLQGELTGLIILLIFLISSLHVGSITIVCLSTDVI